MAGTRETLRKGNWVGKAPFGYDQFRQNGEQQIRVNQDGQLLKLAFEWKAEGIKAESILVRLRAKGLRLYAQHLSEIFRNPFYCGLLIHGAIPGEIIEGKHEVLISKELFLRVNEVLSANPQHYQHEKENREVPLRRFVKCATCGTSFAGYLVKKKGLYYYKCNQKGCACNRSAKLLHELFSQLLAHYQIDKRLIPALKKQLTLAFAQMNESQLKQSKSLQESLQKLDEKLEALEKRFAFGEIERGLYEKFSLKLKEEKQPLEEELQKAGATLSNLSAYIEKSLVIASKLGEYWKEGDYQMKEKLQYLVFPEGVLYERENHHYRTKRVNGVFSLIRSLSEEKEDKKTGQNSRKESLSGLVARTGIENY